MTRGKVGGDNGAGGKGASRNMYKGNMGKAKGGVGSKVGGGDGWGGWEWWGGRWRQLYLNNNKKRERKKSLESNGD